MGAVHIGLKADWARSRDEPFEWGVEETGEMGYKHFASMVYFGRELKTPWKKVAAAMAVLSCALSLLATSGRQTWSHRHGAGGDRENSQLRGLL